MNREEKKKMTREKILEAATSLYSERGFADVSIEEISREAGVGKGTVFLHFKSQDNLMEVVIDQLIELFHQQMIKVGYQLKTLEEYLRLHLTILERYEDLYFYFITQRHQLGKAASYSYIRMQSIFAHRFEEVLVSELKLPLDMLFSNWIGFIHYYLVNRDLFGEKNIIMVNKERWISQYLTLVNEGGIVK